NFIDVGDMPTAWGLQVFNNELYMVGGWGSLAKYAGGTSWVSVGGSTNWFVGRMKLDTINNFLYTIGQFNIVDDSILCDGIAFYDGFTWEGINNNDGEFSEFNDIEFYRGDIYGCLSGDSIDGILFNDIARWDGTKFDTLGCGLSGGYSNVMQVFRDTLYVGGSFTKAGGDTAVGLARWYMPPDTTCKYLQPRVQTYEDTFYLGAGSVNVQFYNNNAYVQSWDWDFGDSGTSSIKDPTHIYTDTGIYNVCVTVNDTGCVKTACKTITIVNDTGLGFINLEKINFKLYPNPSDGNFYAEVNYTHASGDAHERAVSIKITGLNGHHKTTIPVTSEKTLINTSGWVKGTYVCNLFVEGKLVRSEKLILK
ncbi:MAG: PKD domain-containing protein, partial [Bacteroidota bacterium]